MDPTTIDRAVAALRNADGLLITAGAGMGVDSGLPDFRGTSGFWQAYPALARARIHFQDIATPNSFTKTPRLAWGFYGHRLNLYRNTFPHAGFALLKQMGSRMVHGCYVFTSNVDGQFQKAGFDPKRIVEIHGSIHHLQCMHGCLNDIWQADDFFPVVDEERCELRSGLPGCPHCSDVARPNILMFGDWNWLSFRTDQQRVGLQTWLQTVERPVVIELGAGRDIATVRNFSERIKATLIRINPREAHGPAGTLSLAMGAREGLERLAAAIAAP